MRRRLAALAYALAAVAVPLTPPAHANPNVVTTTADEFLPSTVSVAKGDTLTYVNADVAPHNVIADDRGPTKQPLFASTTITLGQNADVKGVSALKPGTYAFHCSVHPQMHGSLVVGNAAGTPTPPVTPAVPTGASVPTPTSITVFQGALYATSWGAGTVQKFTILPGGGLAAGAPYATGFSSPLGVVAAPDGTLYVSDSHADGSGTVGRVWAVAPGGATKAVAVDGLPNGRHNTNGMAVHNGRLYVTNGNSTDDGVNGGSGAVERPLSGTLLSVPLTTRNLDVRKNPRGVTVAARGLRNVYDVAFRPGTDEAWFPTNGPDTLDPYGEDLLHRANVRRPAPDFGFPACVYKAPLVRGQNPNVTTRCTTRYAAPEIALGLHVSADGAAFAPDGSALYIAEYGSNDPSAAGHRVVRVPIVNGKAQPPQDVAVMAAPLDLTFGPDGLYVADFDSGAILLLKPVA